MAITRAAEDLLASAGRSLDEARTAQTPGDRYIASHLAALRAAAAVVAVRRSTVGRSPRGSRLRSVWVLLSEVAVELTEWAEFFAASAEKRAAIEAGLPSVSAREADDLMRDAGIFVDRVAGLLDLHQHLRQLRLPGSLLQVG